MLFESDNTYDCEKSESVVKIRTLLWDFASLLFVFESAGDTKTPHQSLVSSAF